MGIFAQHLRDTLHRHHKHLAHLYGVHVPDRDDPRIPSRQIERLMQAAEPDCTLSVTLNPAELEAVGVAFGLTGEEMYRLRVAVVAESVFRVLSIRTDVAKAAQLGEALLGLLLDTDDEVLLRYQFDPNALRADPEEQPPVLSDRGQQIAEGVEPAVELYEEALPWLDMARNAADVTHQHAYAALAATLLAEADTLLTYPPGIVEATPEQVEWLDLIHAACEEAQALGEGHA